MRNYLLYLIIFVIVCSIFLFSTGCAAILPVLQAILSSKAGFLFVPLLSDPGLTGAQNQKLPGMILLFENNPPEGYGPLPGATVAIEGVSTLTDESGYFLLENVPVGTHLLTASHPLYISIQQEVIVSGTEEPAGMSNFRILDGSLLLSIETVATMLTDTTFHFEASALDPEGNAFQPAVSWSVDSPDATIDSNGIFTTTISGSYNVTAIINSVSSSQEGQVSDMVTVRVEEKVVSLFGTVTDSSGKPLPYVKVSVKDNNLFVTTDENGNYELPGVPASSVLIVEGSMPGQYGNTNIIVDDISQPVQVDIVLEPVSGPTAVPETGSIYVKTLENDGIIPIGSSYVVFYSLTHPSGLSGQGIPDRTGSTDGSGTYTY